MKNVLIFLFIVFSYIINAQDLNYNSHEPHKVGDDYLDITSIGEGQNGIIFATSETNATYYKYENEEWTLITVPGATKLIQKITGDEHGNIYAAEEEMGLWIKTSGNWTLYDSNNSIYPESPEHTSIEWDKNNQTLWIGTENGLVKYKDGEFKVYDDEAYYPDLFKDEVSDFCIDHDGSIWVVSILSFLYHIDGENVTKYNVRQSLNLFSLYLEEIQVMDNNDIMILASEGLIKFDRTNFEIIEEHFGNVKATFMDKDNNENLWFSNRITLFNYDFNEYERYQSPFVPEEVYDIFISSNNHLWVAGYDGPIYEVILETEDCFATKSMDVGICHNEMYNFNGNELNISGTYIDTLNYDECDTIVTLNLTVYPEIVLTSSSVLHDDGDEHGSIAIGVNYGNGSFEYNWSDGKSGKSRYFLSEGEYCCSVTNEIGCFEVFCFTVNCYTEATKNRDICFGETYNFNGTELNLSGQYFDTLNYSSCDTIVTLNLTVYPEIELTSSSIIDDYGSENGSVVIEVNNGSGSFTYTWSNGKTGKTIDFLSPGEYCCTVTNEIGCSDIFCFIVKDNTSVSDLNESLIKIYPNPISQGSDLIIKTESFEIIQNFSIYNSLGQSVYSNSNHIQSLNINLNKGLYLLKIKTNNKNIIRHLVVD